MTFPVAAIKKLSIAIENFDFPALQDAISAISDKTMLDYGSTMCTAYRSPGSMKKAPLHLVVCKKERYIAYYTVGFFTNPQSEMKLRIADGRIRNMEGVEAYAKQHPNSRTAKILRREPPFHPIGVRLLEGAARLGDTIANPVSAVVDFIDSLRR